MMEVGDVTWPLDPAMPYLSLVAKAEQVEKQTHSIKDSFTSLEKEPHFQPSLPETLTVDAIASDENQGRTLAATVEDLEIHFSEACHNNFMVFDRSAGQKSLLCHPSVITNMNNVFTFLQDQSDKAAENILNVCPMNDPSAWGARLLAYRESMEAAFTALERVKVNGFEWSGSKVGEHGLMAYLNPVKDILDKNRGSGDCVGYDQGEGVESPLHEETDDIDALLSSDEELSSTFHTLGELSVDNSLTPAGDWDDCSSSNQRNKRKIREPDLEDADRDFVQSDADSSLKVMSRFEGKYTCGSRLAIPSSNPHISEVSLSGAKGSVSRKKLLWMPSLQDKMGKCERNTEFLEDTQLEQRAKLEKVKDTFKSLKTIIPGGDVDDTVAVLEMAVRYIKSLQAKLQKLDARNEIKVNSH